MATLIHLKSHKAPHTKYRFPANFVRVPNPVTPLLQQKCAQSTLLLAPSQNPAKCGNQKVCITESSAPRSRRCWRSSSLKMTLKWPMIQIVDGATGLTYLTSQCWIMPSVTLCRLEMGGHLEVHAVANSHKIQKEIQRCKVKETIVSSNRCLLAQTQITKLTLRVSWQIQT